MKIKIESVQTICKIGPLCWLNAEFLYCLRILSSLASAGAGAVSYQNHIHFPLGMIWENDMIYFWKINVWMAKENYRTVLVDVSHFKVLPSPISTYCKIICRIYLFNMMCRSATVVVFYRPALLIIHHNVWPIICYPYIRVMLLNKIYLVLKIETFKDLDLQVLRPNWSWWQHASRIFNVM